jgi:hypothetical protein
MGLRGARLESHWPSPCTDMAAWSYARPMSEGVFLCTQVSEVQGYMTWRLRSLCGSTSMEEDLSLGGVLTGLLKGAGFVWVPAPAWLPCRAHDN